MDHKQRVGAETTNSVLHGDEFLFNKIISRKSSAGCSSRVYYCRSAEGVPFDWEMQPGTPKNAPKEDVIPPPSPPPAVLSLGLPRHRVLDQPNKSSTMSRFMFWKKTKKDQESNKVFNGSDKFVNVEVCSSDSEFMASTHNSSSSSSRVLVSPSRDTLDGSLSCSPWKFSSIIVSVARRA